LDISLCRQYYFFYILIWRLLKENQIVLVSFENGHQFGLPKPVNVVEEMTAIINWATTFRN